MKVVLVRNAGTKGLLGIFWGNSIAEIWEVIDDETVDPFGYEYATLKPSCIFFPGEEPVAEQYPDEDEAQVSKIPLHDATLGLLLHDAVHNQNECRWKRFVAANEPGGMLHRVMQAVGSNIHDATEVAR